MRFLKVIAVLAGLLVILPAADAHAYFSLIAPWILAYPEACDDLVTQANDCTLCHTSGGFALNSYGAALSAAGLDFLAIGGDDSDEDGRTNDEEIVQDCTHPGDAASPAEPASWSNVKCLYR